MTAIGSFRYHLIAFSSEQSVKGFILQAYKVDDLNKYKPAVLKTSRIVRSYIVSS